MPVHAENILKQALKLSLNDRAALAEGILASIDRPDPELDALWLKEAQDRMAAYRAGKLEAIDAETVFAELGKPI
jgi:putative addiction module component (TIGR02574 family)